MIKAEPRMPSQSELNELLKYDPHTGDLQWKRRGRHWFQSDRVYKGWNSRYSGVIAGSRNAAIRYNLISINGHLYRSHRIIWIMLLGDIDCQIDHIDGDGFNNSLINLRSVSISENQRNRKLGKNTKIGIFGVRTDKRTSNFYVRIIVSGKEIYLGSFHDFFDACCARKSAEIRFGFHENHGSKR